MRRFLVIAVFVAVAVGLFFLWSQRETSQAGSNQGPASGNVAQGAAASGAARTAGASAAAPADERSHLADDLNAPGGTVSADLLIVHELFAAWQTNLKHRGNPSDGDNAGVTAALAGKNDLSLALIPKDHPAINAKGELCDRWGTPFRFHPLSGTQMEIASAGPDKKFGTADDAQFSPWSRASIE